MPKGRRDEVIGFVPKRIDGLKDRSLDASFAVMQAIWSGLWLRPPWPMVMLKVSSRVHATPVAFFFHSGSGTMGVPVEGNWMSGD